MAALNNEDWRSDCKDIVEMQNKARDEGRFTDIQFVTGKEKSKKVFNAHKAILACGSPVFEKMFYGALAEKRSAIEMDDDPEAFEMLLNYIYGKCNKITSLTFAWKYFTIGDKYLVPKIQESAKKYIESISLNEDNFWEIIESKMFESSLFDDKIKLFIMENARRILKSKKFFKVPETIVHIIIEMDKLNVEENELLRAVTDWGCNNLDPANSKSMKKFYERIRFSTLTSNEFFHFLEDFHNAIDAQSSLEILQHLHCPSRHALPKWCCTSNVSRMKEFQKQKECGNRRYRERYDDIW